jgi:hypothetical protein
VLVALSGAGSLGRVCEVTWFFFLKYMNIFLSPALVVLEERGVHGPRSDAGSAGKEERANVALHFFICGYYTGWAEGSCVTSRRFHEAVLRVLISHPTPGGIWI